MRSPDPILLRLAEIRRAFDASFTVPALSQREERRSVLAVRAGEGRFAVHVEELSGVEACRKIVPIPDGAPGLLGVAGIRGRLLAVYNLGALLGQRRQSAHAPSEVDAPRSVSGMPRSLSYAPRSHHCWLLVSKGELGVSFLIEEIEAFLRVNAADLMPAPGGTAGEHVREVLRQGAVIRGVIDIAAITAAVARRAEEGRDGRRQAQ